MLIAKDFYASLLRVNNQWFIQRDNVNPLTALETCMSAELYQALAEQTVLAIKIVSKSSDYRETEPYDHPIILYPEL